MTAVLIVLATLFVTMAVTGSLYRANSQVKRAISDLDRPTVPASARYHRVLATIPPPRDSGQPAHRDVPHSETR